MVVRVWSSPEDRAVDTIKQNVKIPEDRKLRLEVTVPANVPTGEAEVVVVIAPVGPEAQQDGLVALAGCLADSPTFSRDPLTVQRELRDEWR